LGEAVGGVPKAHLSACGGLRFASRALRRTRIKLEAQGWKLKAGWDSIFSFELQASGFEPQALLGDTHAHPR
jgi:hypothetical protein